MENKLNIFIVVPSYNEHKYIGRVLEGIKAYSQNIITVDDGSTDDTHLISKTHTAHALRHDINLGKGAAMKTGCEYAFNHRGADAVIFMDSDDQHDPKHVTEFVKELESGNDLVFGVRTFSKNMPAIKIMANKFSSYLIKLLFGSWIPDIPSGYKAMTKKAYQQVKWDSTDYSVELEIAARTSKQKLDFAIVKIDTIYHDYDRGMTILDAISIPLKLISWKFTL